MPQLEHVEVTQGTDEWLAQRLGRLTSSRAYAAFKRNAPTKADPLGKYSAKRAQLVAALAAERVSGMAAYEAPFRTEAMTRGSELEPEALAAYEAATGFAMVKSGFWAHPELMVGVSFDGHTEDFRRVAEVKCFWPAAHLELLEALSGGATGLAAVPEEYRYQVLHEVAWVPECEQVDFVAYAGQEWPEASRLLVVPMRAGELPLDAYRRDVVDFLAEVHSKVEKIQAWPPRGQGVGNE